MAKRSFGELSPGAVNLGGKLQDALHYHTRERALHYFLYLFDMKVLVTHLNKAPYDLKLAADEGVEVVATDQINSGFRSKNIGPGAYHPFDSTSTATLLESATAFTSMDAAHFCNLGIKPAFVAKIAKYISNQHHAVDPIPMDFYEMLKRVCGDTALLPQRVNIGPDRVIDKVHGELAGKMLQGAAKIVSQKNVEDYKKAAAAAMTEYRDSAKVNGDLGIAACADCYLTIYNDVLVPAPRTLDQKRADAKNNVVPTVPVKPFVDSIYQSLNGMVRAECAAYLDAHGQPRLDPNDYRS
ncbi:MAG TPA: hypothetical protein VIP11_17165 [Gemmatimonadaceae bacterium]